MWKKKKVEWQDVDYPSVIEGLKRIYAEKVMPVEKLYKFDEFHTPLLRDSDFEAKPMVLFLGQYSTGKSSFIKFLLEDDYPGINIGPEPTTDRFAVVMHGPQPICIPGNAVAVRADLPFRSLSKFGIDFLNKFTLSQLNTSILEDMTFVDTPGVLSGEKQRIGRSYEFVGVVEWFAERSDMIVLCFDAHKLDISDEFKRTIEALKGHEEKVRIVLNKADCVTSQQLMRVYGALMWSLGKVVHTPEVMRVYIGSFWDQPYKIDENSKLFDAEREDLLKDLHGLPRLSTIRKVNELVKRARLAKVHAFIISHLRDQMPAVFGKKDKQKQLIAGLNSEFNSIMKRYQLPMGDFPDIVKFKQSAQHQDFTKFPKLEPALIEGMDLVLGQDVPKLMKKFPPEEVVSDHFNPFESKDNYERNLEMFQLSEEDQQQYISVFHSLEHDGKGKAVGGSVRKVLMDSGLPKDTLSKIWQLVDKGKHGCLSEKEFVVAMCLVNEVIAGNELPQSIPVI